jgi:hypothetical protein
LTLRVVSRCILFQGIIGITKAAAVEAEATEQLHLLSAVAESLHVVEVQVRRPPAIIKEIEALPAVCARLRTARVARERAIAKQRHHVNLLTTVFNSRVVSPKCTLEQAFAVAAKVWKSAHDDLRTTSKKAISPTTLALVANAVKVVYYRWTSLKTVAPLLYKRASASEALLNDPLIHAELVAYVLKGLLKRRNGANPDVFAPPLVVPAAVLHPLPVVGDGADVPLPPPVLVKTAKQVAKAAADAKRACKAAAKAERDLHRPPKTLTAAQEVKAAKTAAAAVERQSKAAAKAAGSTCMPIHTMHVKQTDTLACT